MKFAQHLFDLSISDLEALRTIAYRKRDEILMDYDTCARKRVPYQEAIAAIEKIIDIKYNELFIDEGSVNSVRQNKTNFTLEDMRRCYDGLLQNIGTCIKQTDLPKFDDYIEYVINGYKVTSALAEKFNSGKGFNPPPISISHPQIIVQDA